jgi:YbbR domain-containing protein
VEVQLRSVDPRVRVLGFEPQTVTVDLDRLSQKTVPVQIDHGEPPATMTIGQEIADPAEVRIVGPASVLERVTGARASVVIQTSGIDVDEDVELIAVDSIGDAVSQVKVEPSTAHIRVEIFSDQQSKTLPVSPQITGSPAAGYQLTAPTVEPSVITVKGDADDLQALASIDTQPIPVGGLSAPQTVTVGFALPPGVIALDAQEATVTIGVQAVTGSRTFEVGLRTIGVRAEFEYQLAVDRLLITVGGSPADLDRIVGATLAADLDVSALGPGTTDVTVGATLPNGVTLVAASPPQVAVTVTPRPTPPPS